MRPQPAGQKRLALQHEIEEDEVDNLICDFGSADGGDWIGRPAGGLLRPQPVGQKLAKMKQHCGLNGAGA